MVKLRKAFTLIEVLVVMVIIAILMSLLLSGLSSVRRSVQRTQVQFEISVVEASMNKWMSDNHTQPMKLTGGGPNGEFRLCSKYAGVDGKPITEAVGGITRVWPEVQWMLWVFPGLNLQDNGLRHDGNWFVTNDNPLLMDANQMMVVWTTGSTFTNFQGLSYSTQQPFAKASGDEKRKKTLDMPNRRYMDDRGVVDGRLRDLHGTPYAIFAIDPTGRERYPNVQCFGISTYLTPEGLPHKPKSFQIISAGRDKQYGSGGVFTAGQGSWASGQPGHDDYSNIWPTNLGREAD